MSGSVLFQPNDPTVAKAPVPQRITVTETQMVMDIIANTDTVPPTEVVEKLITTANKWRYDGVALTPDGHIFVAGYDDDMTFLPERRGIVIIDQNGIVPAPWSDDLIEALKKSYEIYSLDWLTGG
jgi:hypothetical protein